MGEDPGVPPSNEESVPTAPDPPHGGYPPQPPHVTEGAAPPTSYQPAPGGHPPTSEHPPYPPQQTSGAYPPQYPPQGAYPPQQGGHSPQPPQGGYPPQYPPQGAYPPQQGAYPPQPPHAQGGYPAQAPPGAYPVQAHGVQQYPGATYTQNPPPPQGVVYTNTAVTTRPVVVIGGGQVINRDPMYDQSYKTTGILSLASCLCFCCPIGLFALYKVYLSNEAAKTGNANTAESLIGQARKIAIIAIIVGIFGWVLLGILA